MKNWREDAHCQGVSIEVFYDHVWPESGIVGPHGPADLPSLHQAIAVCALCPVRAECFTFVMDEERGCSTDTRFGVAAGVTPAQRWSIEKRESGYCSNCGAVLDPILVVKGPVDCSRCGRHQDGTPIPIDGDKWTKRHSDLHDQLLQKFEDEYGLGSRVPGPTKMSTIIAVRANDVSRVYAAFVENGTLLRNGTDWQFVDNGTERTDVVL